MKHGDTGSEVQAGQAQWRRILATSSPETVHAAEQWAHAMEKLLFASHAGAKVEHIALKTLESACGKTTAANSAMRKELVLILRKSWYRGESLYRWARRKGYL